MTSRIDQVLADFRARVMDRDATTQRMLTERWLAVEARLDAQATALALEIDTLRNAGQTITPGKLARLDRYQALLAQAQVEVEQYERWANGQIAENQRVYAEMGRGYFEAAMQAALTNPEGIAVNFNRLPVGATNAMIGFTGNGAPLLDLLIKDYPKTAAGLTQALVNGTAQGWNPRKTAREMMRAMGGNLDRALVIARTEQLRSYRAAAQVGLESNADILDGWVWSSALTANTCPVCWALHGSIHPVTEAMQDHVCGRCHPAGVLVSGPVPVAATTRYYQGKIVRIRTASGIELSLTPNHPVLTPGGWIACGLLKEGDYVISGSAREQAAASVNKNNYDAPSLIEEVFKSFDMVSGEMPSTAKNFHGDGMNSDVYVVRTNRQLWNSINATLSEPGQEHAFGLGDVGLVFLLGQGHLMPVFDGVGDAGCVGLGNRNSPAVFFDRDLLREQSVGRNLISDFYTGFSQPDPDHVSADAIGFGDGVLGFTRLIPGHYVGDGEGVFAQSVRRGLYGRDGVSLTDISKQTPFSQDISEPRLRGVEQLGASLNAHARNIGIDRILEVEVTSFSGHVYSLQTQEDWYISRNYSIDAGGDNRGVITHNCTARPLTKPWKEIGKVIGVDLSGIEETRTAVITGDQALSRRGEDFQRELLGPGRYELWKSGVKLADMVTWKDDPEWGRSPALKPLKEFADAVR